MLLGLPSSTRESPQPVPTKPLSPTGPAQNRQECAFQRLCHRRVNFAATRGLDSPSRIPCATQASGSRQRNRIPIPHRARPATGKNLALAFFAAFAHQAAPARSIPSLLFRHAAGFFRRDMAMANVLDGASPRLRRQAWHACQFLPWCWTAGANTWADPTNSALGICLKPLRSAISGDPPFITAQPCPCPDGKVTTDRRTTIATIQSSTRIVHNAPAHLNSGKTACQKGPERDLDLSQKHRKLSKSNNRRQMISRAQGCPEITENGWSGNLSVSLPFLYF